MLDAEDWKVAHRSGLNEIMDQAIRAGARSDQVFDAMAQALQAMREEWARDPEPAEDPEMIGAEEPANNWPAADW